MDLSCVIPYAIITQTANSLQQSLVRLEQTVKKKKCAQTWFWLLLIPIIFEFYYELVPPRPIPQLCHTGTHTNPSSCSTTPARLSRWTDNERVCYAALVGVCAILIRSFCLSALWLTSLCHPCAMQYWARLTSKTKIDSILGCWATFTIPIWCVLHNNTIADFEWEMFCAHMQTQRQAKSSGMAAGMGYSITWSAIKTLERLAWS